MSLQIFNVERGPRGPAGTINFNSVPIDETWGIVWYGFTEGTPRFNPSELTDFAMIEEYENTAHFTGQINFRQPLTGGLQTDSNRSLRLLLTPPESLRLLFPPCKDNGFGSSSQPGSLSAIANFTNLWHTQGTRVETGQAGPPVDNGFVFQFRVSQEDINSGVLQLGWSLIYEKE